MSKNNKPFEIIVLGPPVSGKGTQAELLAGTFSVPHISTGQILHLIKSDKNHVMSAEVSGYMDSGQLVPSDLVNQLVAERIKQADCALGYVLDGYPRTISQAEFISGISDLDYVFLIEVKDEVIMARMSGRRVCKNGHAWHLKYSPPKDEVICDTCGEPLFQRDDDKPETVNGRLAIFHRETDPILKFYGDKGVLIKIDGDQHIEEVYRSMVRLMVDDLRKKVKL